jgi:tetratricopeptide (TPR) repeat protein
MRRPIELPARGPFRRFLAQSTYVDAIGSIGAALADGLQYAHHWELVHMDIKSSNVLLAGDGQPMLLDFHLARGPISPGGPPPAWMGGTPEFMSPEQRDALDAVREGRPVRHAVDARTDIYSLGMTLYVALGGAVPDSYAESLPPLHRCNRRVSLGLSDIIHKCLQHDPRHRNAEASGLASDLRRHLGNLPLRGVSNRSWAERWHKWRRRRPSALSRSLILSTVVVSLAVAAAAVGFAYRQRILNIEAALARGRAQRAKHHYAEAADSLRQGLALTDHTPAVERQERALRAELDLALRQGQAAEIHRLAETVRFRYGMAPPPPEESRSLLRLGQAIWEQRAALLRRGAGRDDSELSQQIRTDLLDLVVVWADLRVHYTPPAEAGAAKTEALRILGEAQDLLGPSPSLEHGLQAYAEGVGGNPVPAGPAAAPRSAWEYYDLGRSYLRSGRLDVASEQFRLGLDREPQDFWLNFYEGLCEYRLGRFEGAISAFRACIALSPGTAECYYNRALAYQGLGRLDRALADYNRAVSLNPSLTDAVLNCGILHYRQGRHADAIADLERALTTTSSPAARGVIHYNLAVVHLARRDREAASASIQAAIRFGNGDAQQLRRRLDRPAALSPAGGDE